MPSKEYLTKAANIVPDISEDDKKDFEALADLITKTLGLIENIMKNITAGEANLIGNIAENLQNSLGLINRQIR